VKRILAVLPGVALAAFLMIAGLWLADAAGHQLLSLAGINPAGKASPISSVLAAILLGIAVRNVIGLPDSCVEGVRFTVTKLLRLGIILVGIKLSVADVLKLGAIGIPVVVVCISTGLLFISWFGRLMHLPPRLAVLIAAGTSICGVTAIVSTAPAIDAEDKEVAYAVSIIAVFGMLAMLIYPYLARVLLSTSEQIGLFLGTAVHDTSQVVGAAMAYKEVFQDERVLQAATVTKLTRNLFLAVVVPLLSYFHLRFSAGGHSQKVEIRKLLPMFVLGFVGMATLRSIGDAAWNSVGWKNLTNQIGEVWGSRYLLGSAMAAVGLGTSFSVFRGVGFKPFFVGFVGAIVVGLTGFTMALLLGRFVHL
jgi:uncharacterized integral membrane protein (TIGR00698 family)